MKNKSAVGRMAHAFSGSVLEYAQKQTLNEIYSMKSGIKSIKNERE